MNKLKICMIIYSLFHFFYTVREIHEDIKLEIYTENLPLDYFSKE